MLSAEKPEAATHAKLSGKHCRRREEQLQRSLGEKAWLVKEMNKGQCGRTVIRWEDGEETSLKRG